MDIHRKYNAVSAHTPLGTLVPANLFEPTNEALETLRKELGDVDKFVCKRTHLTSIQLKTALSAEQVDSVAMAIRNIEQGMGMIIGDQTGLGKGRQAAAIIRYAIKEGLFPIFFTAKKNLFSDLFRDMKALFSSRYKPLFLNSNSKMVDYSKRISFEHDDSSNDEPTLDDYVVVHKCNPVLCHRINTLGARKELADILMEDYDYMVATYSQLNQATCLPRFSLLHNMVESKRVLLVLDEAHEASGKGNTGKNILSLVEDAYGCVYLSATFAKRVDNLILYSPKTLISRHVFNRNELQKALVKGGLPMQELLSAQLVRAGQMIRREMDYTNVDVCYDIFSENKDHDVATYNHVMELMRLIQDYRESNQEELERIRNDAFNSYMSDSTADHSKEAEKDFRKAIYSAGLPSVFSFISMLSEALTLSLKAQRIAQLCIQEVRNGNKVIIALSKTSESSVLGLMCEDGSDLHPGAWVDASFNNVLLKALERTTRFEGMQERVEKYFEPQLGENHRIEETDLYLQIQKVILNAHIGLPISPIDIILDTVAAGGVRIEECTARQSRLQYVGKGQHAYFLQRKKLNIDWLYNEFQNNNLDVLLINASGALGASAHAVATVSVPASEVKRRVMIIAQPELDINVEVQKRGRINRLGQIPGLRPKYIYACSAIPHEQRVLMMLKRKLKSLDANTSAYQQQNKVILDCVDFYNKYGDIMVNNWLDNNPDVCRDKLGNPRLNMQNVFGLAQKTSSRTAILPCSLQERFYTEVITSYEAKLRMLDEEDANDIETSTKHWNAKFLSREVFLPMSVEDKSANTYISCYECVEGNNPFTFDDVVTEIMVYNPLFNPSKPYVNPTLTKTTSMIEDFYLKRMLDSERDSDTFNMSNEVKINTMAIEQSHIIQVLTFFRPGRYVVLSHDGKKIDAIVSHISFGEEPKTRYLPGNVNVHFILAHRDRRLVINAHESKFYIKSGYTQLLEIMQESCGMCYRLDYHLESMRDRWTKKCSMNNQQIVRRYLLTGNLLSAYTSPWASKLGRMVAFMDSNNQRHYGILLKSAIATDFLSKDCIAMRLHPVPAYAILRTLSPNDSFMLLGNKGVKIELSSSGDDIILNTMWWHKSAMLGIIRDIGLSDRFIKEDNGSVSLLIPFYHIGNMVVSLAKAGYILSVPKKTVNKYFA